MSENPFLLPGAPGEKTLADNLDQGALFEAEDGTTYAFRGLLPGGRWALYSFGEEPRPLMMPDPVTGFPFYPTHDQMLAALAAEKLHIVSSPLDTPARNAARGLERTKKEVLKDDPYAEVRMLVCRTFDKERPARDEASLEEWRDRRFDWEAINRRFGRETPEASTIRAWVNKRGRPGNRCWTDMEDRRGQGPRRRRVTGKRLAIAVWHAVSHWTARRHPTVSKLWKDVEADTNAYNTGKPLIMHMGERRWATPSKDEQFEPVDREFFRQLVKRLESRNSYRCRYNAQAAQQRWEGGGSAPEPVRFLEIVQQDETEAPNFFFIDTLNRVPLGCATWVIAVCVYTRCVLAWDLSFDAPSKVSWMRNVLNASRMKPLPKEWAERFPALATIGGRMSSIMYDNPSHLIGHAVEDAHGDLVQDVIFAGEGQPTHKALVERTHETLRTLFAAELPGAKMQVALAREYNMDSSKETLLTLSEGRLAMARAVCKYHTTELKGLDMRTPLDVWVEQWNLWGPQHAKDQEQFARAIGDVTRDRALDNGGVVNEHLEYSDRRLTPALMEAYAARSHRRRNCKKPTFDAKVKFDPTDMSAVSVLDPVSGKYRKLPAKKKRYTKGLTLAMHKLVLRYRGAQSLMADPQGEERLLELRRMAETELRAFSKKMEAAEQRARASIMQQPVLRDMMGGDIHLVEVAPSTTGMEVEHDHAIGRIDGFEKSPRAKRGSRRNDSHAQVDGSESDDVTLSIPAHFQETGPGAGRLQDGDPSDPDPPLSGDATAAEGEADADQSAAAGRGRGNAADPPGAAGGPDDDDDIVGTFEDY
jgi:hypothetical protein